MSGGTVGVSGDAYNPLTSSGIAKDIADALSAAFTADFLPGAATQMGKKGIEGVAQAIANAIQNLAPPVGTIVGLRTDIVGMPTIGTWVPMDGRTISDPDSVFNGLTIEDWNGTARFLRGGATAGVQQTADAVVPNHSHGAGSYAVGSHTHTPGTLNASHTHEISNGAGAGIQASVSARARNQSFDGATDFISTTSPTITGATAATQPSFSGSSANDGGSGAETRPINGSVTWIIRIK